MSNAPEAAAIPVLPRVLGHVGFWTSVGTGAACLGGLFLGEAGLMACTLFLPVAVLAVWLWWGFLRLEDWRVAPDIPLGVKVIGHGARVVGSVAAALCVSLLVLTIIQPGVAPPAPLRLVEGQWQPVAAGSAAYRVARPTLSVMYLGGFLLGLGVRVLGSAMSELRRWARSGVLVALGAVVAGLTVVLALRATQWNVPLPVTPLIVADSLLLVWFLFLLGYLVRPQVVAAFEDRGL